jgi:hypothetical protein
MENTSAGLSPALGIAQTRAFGQSLRRFPGIRGSGLARKVALTVQAAGRVRLSLSARLVTIGASARIVGRLRRDPCQTPFDSRV